MYLYGQRRFAAVPSQRCLRQCIYKHETKVLCKRKKFILYTSFFRYYFGLRDMVRSLACWFVRWFVRWFVGSLVRLLVGSLVGSFVGSFGVLCEAATQDLL